MDKQEIKDAVEAIQWQADGMIQVLYNVVAGMDDEKWRTLSAGLSLISLAAGNIYTALDEPQDNPQ